MVAACREFRRWSLNHQAEFGLLFGVPLPGLDDGRYDVADECALAFAGTFFALFLELWNAVPFPVPQAAEHRPRPAGPAPALPRRAGHRHPGRRGADVPALLDGAVRRGGDGGVRPPEVRAGGSGAHVRAHARRPGHPGRPALPAARRPPRAERAERGGRPGRPRPAARGARGPAPPAGCGRGTGRRRPGRATGRSTAWPACRGRAAPRRSCPPPRPAAARRAPAPRGLPWRPG